MAIRQTPTGTILSTVITGSAFASGDVIGVQTQVQYGAGANGAWLGNLKVFDYASGGQNMRMHFFNAEPSGYNPSGIPFAIANADDLKYLGFVDVTGWTSAGASKRVAVMNNPGVALHAQSGARHVWVVNQALASTTFGDSANPIHIHMATIQDSN